MKWTKELPKCDGFYWYKKNIGDNLDIVQVRYTDDPELTMVWFNGGEITESLRLHTGAFWSGPIPEPED